MAAEEERNVSYWENDKGEIVEMEHPTAQATDPPSYPSTFFTQNGHTPPSVIVFKDKHSYEDTIDAARASLRRNSWSEVLWTTFIWEFIENNSTIFTANSEVEWSSFGVRFVEAGGKVSPLNFLSAIPSLDKFTDLATDKTNTDSASDMFWSIVGCYRLSRVQAIDKGSYREDIAKKIRDHLAGAPFKVSIEVFDLAESLTGGMYRFKNLTRLIAAIDLFFLQFPGSDYSAIRMCTMPARFNGCSVLLSWTYLAAKIGIKTVQLSSYLFYDPLKREMTSMTKIGEELQNMRSYSNYPMDFGLTTKSPYSSSSCPALHLWIHMIGIMFLLPRSKNAIRVEAPMEKKIADSAIITACALMKLKSANIQFAATKDELERQKKAVAYLRASMITAQAAEKTAKALGAKVQIGAGRPQDVLQVLYDCEDVPDEVGSRVRSALQFVGKPRPKTLGEYFCNLYTDRFGSSKISSS